MAQCARDMTCIQRILRDAINDVTKPDDFLVFRPPLSVIVRESQLVMNGTVEGDNDLVAILYEQYGIEKEGILRILQSDDFSSTQLQDMQETVAEIICDDIDSISSVDAVFPHLLISVLSWDNAFTWFLNTTEDRQGY